jgi:hypothetical protein|tara:strand:+ start:7031 stop:7918 length:888 start_codon:yes stop_codon:yes gene_type:complete
MSNEQITENNTSPVDTTPQPETSTETTATDTLVSSTTDNTVQTAKSWKETISEEFRNDPNISKFTEIDALAKSYINATRMIGSDKVIIPNNNSTDDQWNEVYDKLGRPESSDKYKLDFKSEVTPIDENAIKAFADVAHKTGLNEKQAQSILDFYKQNSESTAQQLKIDTETAQAKSEQLLRQEWGKQYDENINKAAAIAKANMPSDVLDMQLKDGTRLGDHPDVIKGFSKIAGLLSEDKVITTESESVDQGRDLEGEISKIINDRSGPYWNKGHPDHDKLVQQVYTMREMINGGK